MKLSIIIPVYKVEKFIGRCITSLMNQTYKEEFEIIIVDDASPDSSIAIAEKALANYPEKREMVRIIRHERNKGLPAARNTGLAEAKGEYIYHLDSDDYIEPDMLQLMMEATDGGKIDVVYCDFFLTSEKNERVIGQPTIENPQEALRTMLGGQMKYNVWNKIIRRRLYDDHNITFPAGHGMGEDMTIMKLMAVSDSVAHVSKPLYHYIRYNSNAFSVNYTDRSLNDLRYNIDNLSDFLLKNCPEGIEEMLHYFRLSAKYPFLIGGGKREFELWRNMYPTSNKYIISNPYMDLKSKLLQGMAAKNLYLGVRLYNVIVYKFLYKLIYS